VTLYNQNSSPLTVENFSPTVKDVESDKWAVERRGWGKEGGGGVGEGRGELKVGGGGADKNGGVKAGVEESNRMLSRAAGVVNEAVQRGDSRGVRSPPPPHTHTRTHADMHMQTWARTRIHTHTHTHTQTGTEEGLGELLAVCRKVPGINTPPTSLHFLLECIASSTNFQDFSDFFFFADFVSQDDLLRH
jgi:hypothetical protein